MENMDREKLNEAVKLCLAVYRLTDNFSAGEILKQKIREAALNFLEVFISGDADGIIKQVRMLGCFFILAQKQGWADVKNYGALFAAYKNLSAAVNESKAVVAKAIQTDRQTNKAEKVSAEKEHRTDNELSDKRSAVLSDRQKSIAGLLGDKSDGANFGAITADLGKRGFMDVTARTIRNDLKQMVKFGVIEQAGWAKKSVYRVKRGT